MFRHLEMTAQQHPCLFPSLCRHPYDVLIFRDECTALEQHPLLFAIFFGLRNDVSTFRDEQYCDANGYLRVSAGFDPMFRHFKMNARLYGKIPAYLQVSRGINTMSCHFEMSVYKYCDVNGYLRVSSGFDPMFLHYEMSARLYGNLAAYFPGIDTIFRYFEIIVQLCSSIPGYLFLRASIRCFDISARLYGSISG
jgi:hypothetical protein